jgi:hypothetical protein
VKRVTLPRPFFGNPVIIRGCPNSPDHLSINMPEVDLYQLHSWTKQRGHTLSLAPPLYSLRYTQYTAWTTLSMGLPHSAPLFVRQLAMVLHADADWLACPSVILRLCTQAALLLTVIIIRATVSRGRRLATDLYMRIAWRFRRVCRQVQPCPRIQEVEVRSRRCNRRPSAVMTCQRSKACSLCIRPPRRALTGS